MKRSSIQIVAFIVISLIVLVSIIFFINTYFQRYKEGQNKINESLNKGWSDTDILKECSIQNLYEIENELSDKINKSCHCIKIDIKNEGIKNIGGNEKYAYKMIVKCINVTKNCFECALYGNCECTTYFKCLSKEIEIERCKIVR